jgi:hypothetical protein
MISLHFYDKYDTMYTYMGFFFKFVMTCDKVIRYINHAFIYIINFRRTQYCQTTNQFYQ